MELFLGGFGIFTGIVAGALIQHALNGLTAKRQARNALKVLQIEISNNLSEVTEFLERLNKLRSRIEAGQATGKDMFFAMHKFDYSSMAPLNNSGYFHMLLGPERLKAYLEFVHFFRAENGEFLAQRLNEYHEQGRSIDWLDWIEERAKSISQEVARIENAKLARFGLKMIEDKQKQ